MTTPPQPGQPGPYSQEPHHPQQPPYASPADYPAPQQGYPAPQPGYPAPHAGYAPAGATGARPGLVTAASVIALVIGGLSVISGLIGFSLLSIVGGLFALVIILTIVAAAGLIWGGIQTLNGKDGRIIVIAAGVAVLVNLISMIIYFAPTALINMILPILIIVFMVNPQSKAWIRAQGGQTF